MEKVGFENLRMIAQCVGILATVGYNIGDDGKITIADLAAVPKLFPLFTKLISINFSVVASELKDLDAEEIKYIEQAFAEECQLPNAKYDALLESGFKALMTILSFIQAVKKEKDNG